MSRLLSQDELDMLLGKPFPEDDNTGVDDKDFGLKAALKAAKSKRPIFSRLPLVAGIAAVNARRIRHASL